MAETLNKIVDTVKNSFRSSTRSEKKTTVVSIAKRRHQTKRLTYDQLLQAVSMNAVTRLCRRAGITRANEKVIRVTRRMLNIFLSELVYNTVTMTTSERRKIVLPKDVRQGLRLMGIRDYASV